MKFLLYYFESMSQLKINYKKSDVIVVKASNQEQKRVANMLNCKIGSLPIKYLVISVSNTHLRVRELMFMGQKVENKIGIWQCMYLSSGGNNLN